LKTVEAMEKEKLKEKAPAQQAEDAHYDESLDLHAAAAERTTPADRGRGGSTKF